MNRPLIGIPLGDPAGVGPEIVVKSLNSDAVYEMSRPVVVGDKNTYDSVDSKNDKELPSTFMAFAPIVVPIILCNINNYLGSRTCRTSNSERYILMLNEKNHSRNFKSDFFV